MQKVVDKNDRGAAGSGAEMTSIINPSVQTNLNELIKTQRDKVLRMS